MKNFHSIRRPQAGAALVVSLIFLLIMTILALSMSQTTTLEERMAGNARDANSAFQGAEAAQSAGQTYLDKLGVADVTMDSTGLDLTVQIDGWWSTNGTEFGTAAKEMVNLNTDPHYVIRPRALRVTHGSLATPPSQHTTSYYEVFGRSRGNTGDSEAVNSEIVAIPDN